MSFITLENIKQHQCTGKQILILKQKYELIIDSIRTYGNINSIKDLLNVLEKRDHIDSSVIREIAGILNIKPIIDNIHSGQNENKNQGQYPEQLNTIGTNNDIDKIYETIYENLGSHWLEFARYLEIPEGRIDALHTDNNTRRSIKYILKYHEEHCSPERWRQKILHALEKCRRKDLSKKVENMLDRYYITRPVHR